jgi:hypothetical protein
MDIISRKAPSWGSAGLFSRISSQKFTLHQYVDDYPAKGKFLALTLKGSRMNDLLHLPTLVIRMHS